MGEKTVDMTKGSILPKMIRFALPVLLGMLFQRIYNFVDVYIVGRYLGDEALAAVSIAGGAMYLLFSIMMGLTTGVSVVVSQYYGGGDEKKVTETFVSSIYVAVVSTLIITIAGLIGARPLLRILQTSNDLLDQATVYLHRKKEKRGTKAVSGIETVEKMVAVGIFRKVVTAMDHVL